MDTGQTHRRCNFKFIDFFLAKGSIHGLPYIGNKLLTVFERVVWSILTLVALYISIQLALGSIDKFKTKSTVITIEKDYRYWNTTLPSLTICPMNRLSSKKFESYCETHGIAEKDRSDLFKFLDSLANSTYLNFEHITEPPNIQNYSIDPIDYMHLIYNLTDNLLETDIVSQRNNELVPAQQVLTEWGICYTTNNFLLDDISTKNLLFGRRPDDASSEEHMVVANAFDSDVSYIFTKFLGPIEIFIHDPNEVMQYRMRRGSTTMAVEITVKMLEILASDEFGKENTIEQRNCRFPNESNLKHFPIYTSQLCQQQCRINLAYKLCKCIPHFYPNLNAKTPVCHYKVLKECLSKYKDYYENPNKMIQLFKNQSIQCECMPNCRITQLLETNWRFIENFLILGTGAQVTSVLKTRIRYRRQTILTLTDLLVSLGGSAGFFLGFNVLSAMEIVYYFTIRLFWYCFNYRE